MSIVNCPLYCGKEKAEQQGVEEDVARGMTQRTVQGATFESEQFACRIEAGGEQQGEEEQHPPVGIEQERKRQQQALGRRKRKAAAWPARPQPGSCVRTVSFLSYSSKNFLHTGCPYPVCLIMVARPFVDYKFIFRQKPCLHIAFISKLEFS